MVFKPTYIWGALSCSNIPDQYPQWDPFKSMTRTSLAVDWCSKCFAARRLISQKSLSNIHLGNLGLFLFASRLRFWTTKHDGKMNKHDGFNHPKIQKQRVLTCLNNKTDWKRICCQQKLGTEWELTIKNGLNLEFNHQKVWLKQWVPEITLSNKLKHLGHDIWEKCQLPKLGVHSPEKWLITRTLQWNDTLPLHWKNMDKWCGSVRSLTMVDPRFVSIQEKLQVTKSITANLGLKEEKWRNINSWFIDI